VSAPERRGEVRRAPVESGPGVALLGFASGLCGSGGVGELAGRVVAGFGGVVAAPLVVVCLCDRGSGWPGRVAAVNVSEVVLARYERLVEGRASDPLFARVVAGGGVAYNLGLMSMREWLASPLYRRVWSVHRVRHLVVVPVVGGEGLVGTITFAAGERGRGFAVGELGLAGAVGRLVGVALEGLRAREELGRGLGLARAALELSGSAVVVSEPELWLNGAARRLVGELRGGEERLYGLLAPPAGRGGGFARRLEVELVAGGRGWLHGFSSRPGGAGGLVTVLELERERPGRALGPLLVLTAREREVAALVVEGLADREIAERLRLSRHTVSQYVKRVYRKLGVGSRVALTRLLLAPARPDHPTDRAGPQPWGPAEHTQPGVLPPAAEAA
jgi:DNA-binding CsgD family transcriptional regulator